MSKQTRPKSHSNRRTQQTSVGGILITLLIALITWWNSGGANGSLPAAPGGPVTVATIQGPATAAAKATPPKKATAKAEKPAAPTKKTTPKAAAQKAPSTATPQPPATPTRAPTRKPTATPTRAKPPTPTTASRPTTGVSGLPTIQYERLPKEARRTIELIDQGGPFPFDRDGIVFQNREGLLPRKARNYYHEYTVITPGESDRGARRIIAGDKGELYYTADHYDSFQEVEHE